MRKPCHFLILANLLSLTPAFALSPKSDLSNSSDLVQYGIIGTSGARKELYKQIQAASKTSKVVLIEGETGTGKELVAWAIHQMSQRNKGPYVAVNVMEPTSTLAGSEFLGHKKGAFTGAVEDRKGYFEAADGGTIFLDEIADLPEVVQGRLRDVIENKRITRIGATHSQPVDIKIITSTNKNLEALVREGKFSADLYDRVNGFRIRIPALRERPEDILLLAEYYLEKYANQLGIPKKRLSQSAKNKLNAYHWPGNVRELQSLILRALLYADGEMIYARSLIFDSGSPTAPSKIDFSKEDRRFKEILNREGIIGQGGWMFSLSRFVRQVGRYEVSCLLTGERGTGKSIIAKAIHRHSRRKEGPLKHVDCGGLGDLLEDQLFGHKRGAFTDAREDTKGLLEEANGGILVLEEVSSLTASAQAKLLRVLQEREFRKIGETETREIDVQIIATTNKDIEGLVEKGEFRSDLYYRLNLMRFHLPPLRDRQEDIPLWVNRFLEKTSHEYGKEGMTLDKGALEVLKAYPWPENLRGLENCLDRAVLMADGDVIRAEDLRFPSDYQAPPTPIPQPIPQGFDLDPEEVIKDYLNWGPIRIGELAPEIALREVKEEAERALLVYAMKKYPTDPTKPYVQQRVKFLQLSSRHNWHSKLQKYWNTADLVQILQVEIERERKVQVLIVQETTFEYGVGLAIEKAILSTLAKNNWEVQKSFIGLDISRHTLSFHALQFWESLPREKYKIAERLFDKMEEGYQLDKIRDIKRRRFPKDFSRDEIFEALRKEPSVRQVAISLGVRYESLYNYLAKQGLLDEKVIQSNL